MAATSFRQNAHTTAHPSSQELGNQDVSGVNGHRQPFRILCAVDASPPAAAAFEQALALSAHRGRNWSSSTLYRRTSATVGVPSSG